MRLTFLALLFWLIPQTLPSTPQPAPTIAAAQAAMGAGNAAGAKAILEKVVEASPGDVRAWNTLGALCLGPQLKDYDCAIAALSKVLTLQPGDPRALLSTGIAHAAKGDLDSAFRFLEQAKATRRIDMTQLAGNASLVTLRNDPRYRGLLPLPADFVNPFVEPTKVVREWTAEGAGDQFGWIARSIGDVDGDKVQDFVTSAPGHGRGGVAAGRIYVYSTKSGKVLWTADGAAGDQLGLGVEGAGDVNNDGAGDVVASSPPGGYAKIYNGRTGAVLLTLKAGGPSEAFGRHVSSVGDVNGDKMADVIIGAPGAPNAPADFPGRAYIFSGKDGALLKTLSGERAGDQFGAAVTGSNDRGGIVITVGAPRAGAARTGRAYIYTSLSEAPAFTVEGDATGSALGAMFVAVAGDMDADGVPDVYVSDWSNSAKGPSTGRVYVYSARTGRLIHALTGETAGEGFGTSQSTAGDADGDGVADLIVGSWHYAGAAIDAGRAYLYSGKTGQLIRTFTCRTPGDTFGFDAVGLGDVDGDGTVDLLVTSAWSAVKGFRSGRIFLISSGVARATLAGSPATVLNSEGRTPNVRRNAVVKWL